MNIFEAPSLPGGNAIVVILLLGVGGVSLPKDSEHFFSGFLPFKAFQSAGLWSKKKIEMSTTFLEANDIKIYAVLSDFANYRDSRIKIAPRVPKIEGGGGFSQFGQCPYLDCFFLPF